MIWIDLAAIRFGLIWLPYNVAQMPKILIQKNLNGLEWLELAAIYGLNLAKNLNGLKINK